MVQAYEIDMEKTSDIIWQDSQHQILFQLIEQIREVPFDPEIIVKLRLYAENHFTLEEIYMEKLCYPDAEAHRTAHNRFRAELEALTEIEAGSSRELQAALSDFLYKWLKMHVLGIDKKLEDFVMNSSAK